MRIKEQIKAKHDVLAALISMPSDDRKQEKFVETLDFLLEKLHSEVVQNELNECAFANKEDLTFLANLMENLLKSHVEFDENTSLKVIRIIEIITKLKIKPYLTISDTFLRRFLSLFLLENRIVSSQYSVNTRSILDIASSLSQNKTYDKIQKTSENDFDEILTRLENAHPVNFSEIQCIRSNLRKRSLQDQLSSIRRINEHIDHLDQIFRDETILNEIREVSLILNNNYASFFYWDLFLHRDLIIVFSRLFASSFTNILYQTDNNNYVDVARAKRPFIHLLEIILRLVHISFHFGELFLEQDVFRMLIQFFANPSLVRFYYEFDAPMLRKICSLFYCLCKTVYYSNTLIFDDAVFSTLRSLRDIIETLWESEKNYKSKFKRHYICNIILLSLSYLQEKFHPDNSLLNTEHYDILITNNMISSSFRTVSDSPLNNNKTIQLEIINEFDQRETRLVTLSVFNEDRQSVISTVVDTLNILIVNYSTNELKRKAYPNFKAFVKSVVFHSPNFEKIIAIKWFNKFSEENSVKEDLHRDNELIEFLKTHQIGDNNTLKTRWKKIISNFFDIVLPKT